MAPRVVPGLLRTLSSAAARVGGAILIIIFNPTTTGCGASPGMISDGNGGCVKDPGLSKKEKEPDVDKSANPDEKDKPNDSENKKDEKGYKKSTEKPAKDLIRGGLKQFNSYHSELENKIKSELESLAKTSGEEGR
jgi:hypothetical protein